MSSINPNNIDGQYPIAGQDNDSQGFRDNFTNIKNNFTFAYDELTDLQGKVILKSALSGGALDNDMNYAELESAQLIKSVETKQALGSRTTSFSMSWADGNFQSFTLGGDLTLTLTNFPTNGHYAKLRVLVSTGATGYNLTLASGPTYYGLSDIQNTAGNVITLAANGTYLFEFSTTDSTTAFYVQDLLRNYDIITTGSSGTFTSLNVSGNVLAAGAVVNALTVNGTTTRAGATVDTGYQIYKPTGNIDIQANVDVSRVIVAATPSGGISDFYVAVTLPNVAINGKLISITSNTAVASFRVLTPWVGYTVDSGANVTLTAGSTVNYLFHSTDNKWFKV